MSWRRWLPPVAWTAFILVLTSLPGSRIPNVGVPNVDKLVHFGLYGVLGLLLTRSLIRPGRLGRAMLVAVVTIAVFAAVDEWHQRFIPGRSPDPIDWLADLSGATLGAAIVVGRYRRAYAA